MIWERLHVLLLSSRPLGAGTHRAAFFGGLQVLKRSRWMIVLCFATVKVCESIPNVISSEGLMSSHLSVSIPHLPPTDAAPLYLSPHCCCSWLKLDPLSTFSLTSNHWLYIDRERGHCSPPESFLDHRRTWLWWTRGWKYRFSHTWRNHLAAQFGTSARWRLSVWWECKVRGRLLNSAALC